MMWRVVGKVGKIDAKDDNKTRKLKLRINVIIDHIQ